MQNQRPSLDTWLDELKGSADASGVGMYLLHNGVVRATARDGSVVSGMELTFDRDLLEEALTAVRSMDGVIFARAWVNEGALLVGDDIMCALVGGDVREHVFAGIQELVKRIKSGVVAERELP